MREEEEPLSEKTEQEQERLCEKAQVVNAWSNLIESCSCFIIIALIILAPIIAGTLGLIFTKK